LGVVRCVSYLPQRTQGYTGVNTGEDSRPTQRKANSLLGCYLSALLFSLCNTYQYRFAVWLVFLTKRAGERREGDRGVNTGEDSRPTRRKANSLLGCYLSALLFSLCNTYQYRFAVWLVFLTKRARERREGDRGGGPAFPCVPRGKKRGGFSLGVVRCVFLSTAEDAGVRRG
jgi:hypothetical protein